ncbi:type II 3-dehydroquinate dehydratase [Agrobacterium tumefaciens]|uniref:type II 3-dehydroquinate dehydratase n=1 Tax=Agrobacterium tumefaciens TaxID=358 RepID=UPI001CC15E5B
MRLAELRKLDTKWHIIVLGGPGIKPGIGDLVEFQRTLQAAATQLGITVEHFQSNHEGKLLEFVHSSRDRANAYLVNPGGLVRVGESLRHTLKDAKKPTVEVHLDNRELRTQSIFAPSVLSIFSGLGQSSYLGGMVALVLALDDMDFLNPEGTSPLNRSHGAPRSLYT